MRRHGNLWQHVISFEALLRAAEQACKGKRFRPNVADFHFNLEHELWTLHEELSTKTYRPGASSLALAMALVTVRGSMSSFMAMASNLTPAR